MNNLVTYNQLYTLYTASGLTPNDTYQITDYSNQFDVVLSAETTNKLCTCCTFTGTTVGVDYTKWVGCYSILPNNQIWDWTNTKGVIYNLYDDKGNSAYFDYITTGIIDYATCGNVTIKHNPYNLPYELPTVVITDTNNAVLWADTTGVIDKSEYITIGEDNSGLTITNCTGVTIEKSNTNVTLTRCENVKVGNSNNNITVTNGVGVDVVYNVSGATINGEFVTIDGGNNITVTDARQIYVEHSDNITINQFSNYIRIYNCSGENIGSNTTEFESHNSTNISTYNNTVGVKTNGVANIQIDGTKVAEGGFIYNSNGANILKNTITGAIYTITPNGDVNPTQQTTITEAPTDGKLYGRQNLKWSEVKQYTAGNNITITGTTNKINAIGYTYTSLNGNFAITDGVADAPSGGAIAIRGEAHGTNATAIGGVAYGDNCVTIGEGTQTNTANFTAMGKFNNPNNNNFDCMQFGWGANTNNRKNIFTITTGGTAWAETDVVCSGTNSQAPAHRLSEKQTVYGVEWGNYTATQSATINLSGTTNYITFSGTTSTSAPTLNVVVDTGITVGDYKIYVADAIRHNYAQGYINPILNISTSLPINAGYSGTNSTLQNPFMLVVHILVLIDQTNTKVVRYYTNRDV